MGTFSEKILGSDNALDVYEDFFNLYNQGKNTSEISEFIHDKYMTKSIDLVERSEYLSAFCKAKWETKSLETETLDELRTLVNKPKLYQLLNEYGATEKFIKKRKKTLLSFIEKISKERPKPKRRKKRPVKYDTQFVNGSCFYFQFKNGEYGGVVIIAEDLYQTEGYFKFALTTIKQAQKPTISDFFNSTFDYCKWYDSEEGKNYKIAGIDAYSIYYLMKKKRIEYFEGLDAFFTYVGIIKPFESGYHSSISIDFSEQDTFVAALSKEMEFSQSQRRKQIHLETYKEELKPDTVKLKDFHLLTKKDN